MYSIVFLPEARVDLRKLPIRVRSATLRKIEAFLAEYPDHLGKPLRYTLKGYYEIKVSSYRVIYQIIREQVVVLIVGIGPRKDDLIFREIERRLGLR